MENQETISGLTARVENLETIIQSNCEYTEKKTTKKKKKQRPNQEEAI